jgi:hypothetical protein
MRRPWPTGGLSRQKKKLKYGRTTVIEGTLIVHWNAATQEKKLRKRKMGLGTVNLWLLAVVIILSTLGCFPSSAAESTDK